MNDFIDVLKVNKDDIKNGSVLCYKLVDDGIVEIPYTTKHIKIESENIELKVIKSSVNINQQINIPQEKIKNLLISEIKRKQYIDLIDVFISYGEKNNMKDWSYKDKLLYKLFNYKPIYKYKNITDFHKYIKKITFNLLKNLKYQCYNNPFIIIHQKDISIITDILQDKSFKNNINDNVSNDSNHLLYYIGNFNSFRIFVCINDIIKDKIVIGLKTEQSGNIKNGLTLIDVDPVFINYTNPNPDGDTVEKIICEKLYKIHLFYEQNSKIYYTFNISKKRMNFLRHILKIKK